MTSRKRGLEKSAHNLTSWCTMSPLEKPICDTTSVQENMDENAKDLKLGLGIQLSLLMLLNTEARRNMFVLQKCSLLVNQQPANADVFPAVASLLRLFFGEEKRRLEIRQRSCASESGVVFILFPKRIHIVFNSLNTVCTMMSGFATEKKKITIIKQY